MTGHTNGIPPKTVTRPESNRLPIAICGMGLRLPGGIRDDRALYNFLVNKGDARSTVGADRFNVDAFYSPHGKPGTICTQYGYFLNDVDFSSFDLSMFTPTVAEVEQLDPNHRLVLEVVREAFESAGESEWRGKKIGTYVGMFAEDWQDMQHKNVHFSSPYRDLGSLDFALSNRIAYEYDLRGPSMVIKTACSAAGTRLHQALLAIGQGEISSAIVCGTNLILAPGVTMTMSRQMALSPEGSSKTFDASADGYARGEGVTALYIKRLDHTIRDRNPIRAVIRSSASNADGKTPGLTFVIDSAASFGLASPKPSALEGKIRKNLLLFSANHPEALKRIAENIIGYLMRYPERVDSLAYTLAQRREHLKLRSYAVVMDGQTHLEISGQTRFQGPRKVAFVFTGQGAQWVHMGKELMLEYQSFLDDIRAMDAVLQGLKEAPTWSIEDILLNSDDKTIIGKAEYSQPICTALQIGLVNLLATWRITPSATVGHSSGEIAAAYAAGILTWKAAIITAFYRGYVCKGQPRGGGMAAIGMSKQEVSSYLMTGVRVACENSGSSVTLSGDIEVLEDVITSIKQEKPDAFARKLQVEMAYHSHHMSIVGNLYYELIAKHISAGAPKIPFYSSVRAKTLHEALDFGPKYWQDNLENPVLFHTAVKVLLAGSKECSVHLEVGPHSALSGPLRQIYSETSTTALNYVSTLVRGKDDTTSFLEAVGQLHSLGIPISYPFATENTQVLSDLPTYPWHYERSYWAETRIMKNWRFRKHLPHDLLGLRILEGSDLIPTWRNELQIINTPWLKDHCVGNDIIFPGACYVAMAGEAVFQITDTRDYTVRDVELSKAMVLYNERPTEIITTLRPQRLTATLDSDWFEFQIVSYDGSAWAKHCSGLVRSGRASANPSRRNQSLDRPVSSSRWYTIMARVGLKYGPRFTGLGNIKASVIERVAAAEVTDRQEVDASPYMLHPATLDLVFQSFAVAECQGVYRTFTTLFLPTFIEELYIGDAAGKDIQINTAALGKPGTVGGSSYGISEGETVFYLKGFQGKVIEGSETETPADLKLLRLQWKPLLDFQEASSLMKPKNDSPEQIEDLERLFVLCAIESKNALAGRSTVHPHMEKYRAWLDEQCMRFQQPGYPLVNDSQGLVLMAAEERQELIPKMLEKCCASGSSAPVTAMWRAYDQVANVFEGKTDYLDLLVQNNVLMGLYSWSNDFWDLTEFVQLLGHAQPQMRILEIGAGTGSFTSKILGQLQSDFGERLYLSYTFTDISSGFLAEAKNLFKEYEGIEYKALDISKDPLGQGFQAGKYDLIIASNVLHATPFLHDTLTNVRTLLKSRGQLFLQELCPGKANFFDWWLGEDDGRVGSPLINPEEWDRRLRAAGFEGCHSVALNKDQPYTYNANIIARPAVTPTPPSRLPADQDLISFLDVIRKPLLQDLSEENLAHFLHLVDNLQSSTVLWLTSPAQIHSNDPHAGQILGMARCIRSELAMSFATLELEKPDSGAAEAVVGVLNMLQESSEVIETLDPDMEYAWVNGALHVGRFHWVPIEKSLSETAPAPETKALTIGTPGLLRTLHWTGWPLSSLTADEVHIKVGTVGLNFKDVMIAMGVIPGGETITDGSSPLGLEGCGYIAQLGADVKDLAIGDRVLSAGCESVGMATTIRRPANQCIKVPDGLSDEEVATMPLVYVTVLMFLMEKWKLEKGQSILIHSAAGGVGIGAINVAKWIGAEIYATVGSDVKASFLIKEYGIPRERIFSSRDSSFLDGVMQATNGRGVDMVLNSLSGELLHTSWKCVAPCGAMAEIGKRDMVGRGKLALDPFEDNRAFIGGDITRLLVTNKPTVARLLALTIEQYQQGNFKPIGPITTFEADQVEEAFRFMQQGSHIGKIVTRFPQEDTLPLRATVPAPKFRRDAAYVLVGGLGGIGKAVASWMASHGAGNLVFLSRSAGKSEEDQNLLKELNLMGCSTQCFPCDITDRDAVQSAIDQVLFPIAGAMEMVMVLRDIGLLGMDIQSWHAAVQPKVQGTWNLHHVLPHDMDFFVLFSSVRGTFGYYGQSNYASANTFLGSFVQYRQGLGLAASVLDIGLVDEIGYVSDTPAIRKIFTQVTREIFMTEQNMLDSLQLTIARSATKYKPQGTKDTLSGYQNLSHIVQPLESRIPIMDPQNSTVWKRDPRMSIYRNIQNDPTANSGEGGDKLKQLLSGVASDPSKLDQTSTAVVIAQELGYSVSNFLRLGDEEIDLSTTLSAAGMDSLVAMEVRNWWKQNLGTDVSVLELMNGGTLGQLGGLAAKKLKEKYSNK
ncbi:putative polyketide synthase [Aspergillus coremiiformis]|uniref:Putative polyketide synthase n=1 Tax=Aspergillus coremiiformis TaxID=138285 RepID=A0A5N6ZCT8_9EURO|nr:putative polyketide synthase [Aspergillus coremiiformis]